LKFIPSDVNVLIAVVFGFVGKDKSINSNVNEFVEERFGFERAMKLYFFREFEKQT
jgi:hypothetical protein